MTHELIAVFESDGNAVRAQEQLSRAGFDPSGLSTDGEANASSAEPRHGLAPAEDLESFGQYRTLWSLLDIGSAPGGARTTDAGGGFELRVIVDSDDDVERAVDIMKACDPLHIVMRDPHAGT